MVIIQFQNAGWHNMLKRVEIRQAKARIYLSLKITLCSKNMNLRSVIAVQNILHSVCEHLKIRVIF